MVEDQVIKPVGRLVLLGGIVKGQHVVLEQRVGKIALRIQPVASPTQVHVPRENGPFARPRRVAKEVVILVPVILIADQRQRDEVTDRLWQIDVVVSINHPIIQWTRFIEVVDQGLQIAQVFVLAGLLLVAAGAAQIVVHLVKRAVGAAPQPRQPFVIAVLRHVRDAEKLPVALEPDGECKMTGRTGRGDHLVGERIAHFGLVGEIAQKPDVFHTRTAGAVPETMVAVEIQVVTLFGPAGGTLPVQANHDVVVELAEIIERTARAAKRVRRARIFHEKLHNRQQRLEPRIGNHRAEVLLGIIRIGKQRPARAVTLCVGRGDTVTNQLPAASRASGKQRAPNAVPRGQVAVGAAVGHRHRRFRAKHDPIVKCDV